MSSWTDVTPPPGEPGERDWGALAFQTARDHWERVQQAHFCQQGECEEHPDPKAESCPDPSHGVGCGGCEDCCIRETLAASWAVIEAAIRSGDFDHPLARARPS